MLLAMACGLLWLNGPGLRRLAPAAARHFLGKQDIRADFRVEGSLTGGFSIRDFRLETDDTLAALTVDRATPVYHLAGLLRGRVDGIEVSGARADLRLESSGRKRNADAPKEKKPKDPEEIVRTLRELREKLVPLAVDLSDISLAVTRDGAPFLSLAPSRIRHGAGDSRILIELGALTDAGGREWPARKSTLTWEPREVSLDRLDLLPGVGVSGLVLRLPDGSPPSAETELRVDDAVFVAETSPGFSSLRLDLREGRLAAATVAEKLALRIPAAVDLTSLSVIADNLTPDPAAATGEVRLLLENIRSGDWTVPELSLDAEIAAERASLAASGQSLGTAFSLHAEAPLTRVDGKPRPGEVSGRFNVAEVSKLVGALADRFKAIDPQAPVPESAVDGTFLVSIDDLKPAAAEVDLVLKPADPKSAASLALKGRWLPDKPVIAEVAIEGLKAGASYDPAASTYQADAAFDSFDSTRIERWLAIAGLKPAATIRLGGTWKGGGDLKNKLHQGELALAALDLTREGAPPVRAGGALRYDWPRGFTASGLTAKTGEQELGLDASLGSGWLDLTNVSWRHRGKPMAGGNARLPIPEDFAKWRDAIATDKRPLAATFDSEVLPLALLKDWFPAAEKLDARSTGKVSLKIAGTFAEPELDVVLEARGLRAPGQPKLPPADLRLALAGRSGRLTVDGRATAPDLPPALLTASMPFRPADWAENPDLIKSEKIAARVDFPRLDLSRFSSLVPAARRISGIVTGSAEVAGSPEKPDLKGRIDLANAGFEALSADVPAVTGAGLALDLRPQRVTLENLRATIAGGTLRGGGSLALDQWKPGALDLRLTADHVPLVRNDSLIVRADADLRLAGTLERSVLSGTVSVVDSLFYRDIELLPIGTPFTAPSAAALPKIDTAAAAPGSRVPEPFQAWGLDLRVRSGNPFLIRGNLATGRVDMDVRVRGTLGSPAPDGEVRISDLRAALPFSTLTVKRGTVRFSPATGLDPVLEIRGTAEPRPYRVNAYVYGRASSPQLVLTSNPPLPENEIMTLLATGTTTTGLEDPQAASSRAMQLLAEELRRGRFAVGKQLRPLLGVLDRVDFSIAEADPYSSESFSTATLMLTDRWFLSAGMGAEGDSRVLGIWRLSFH